MPDPIGTPLGAGATLENRYRIRALLGQGGMSRVYLADDLRLGMSVAVKENLQTNADAHAQFEHEARLLASLSHSNLPRVIDHFSDSTSGRQYLVMDYIEGEDLEAMIKRVGVLPEATALNWIRQILSAVEYLHAQNPPIIHRDIKPANIKITPQGKAVLVDFGIAKSYDPRLATLTGARAVTPGYAPPEQYGMRTTERSDIYALGATLYTALTGRVPPEAPLRVSGEESLTPPSRIAPGKVSAATERSMLQAMELQTDRRWQSVAQMQAALYVYGAFPERPGHLTAAVRRPIAPVSLIILVSGLVVGLVLVLALIAAFVGGQGLARTEAIVASPMAPTAALAALPTAAPRALPTAAPSALPTAAPRELPTVAPSALPIAAPPTAAAAKPKLKVGLVTDVGGVNDKSFNQSAWVGMQRAGTDFGMDVKFIESRQPADYEKNIDQFATSGYDVIIVVGFLMGDATAAKAKQYPNIKFAIIDNAYFPTKGVPYCDDTKKDCYVDGGLTNVTSLMFQEDQVGFLAGVLAGGMTKTGTICTVSGMEIPPVVRFVVGYQNGAKWIKPDVKTLNTYIPSFTDPAKGKETGQSMISQGCDVVFGVGGNTGNGALLAAKEKGLMAIGVDVDQYYTFPEIKDVLITSAQKNVDVAVYNFLGTVSNGSVKAGILTANVQNGGVGIAPYHDWDSKIPQAVKAKVDQARAGLADGVFTTGYRP